MVQDIYIIDDDESSILVFKELFKEDTEYKFISVKSDMIEVALKNIPSMIIINGIPVLLYTSINIVPIGFISSMISGHSNFISL